MFSNLCAARIPARASVVQAQKKIVRGVLGAQGCRYRDNPGRDSGYHRQERLGQIHFSATGRGDTDPNHRRYHHRRAHIRDPRAWCGIQPGIYRSGKCPFECCDPWHDPGRNRRTTTRHRGILGTWGFHFQAGENLLQRDVRPACIFHFHQCRTGYPHHR